MHNAVIKIDFPVNNQQWKNKYRPKILLYHYTSSLLKATIKLQYLFAKKTIKQSIRRINISH